MAWKKSETPWRLLLVLTATFLLAACGDGGESPEDRLRSTIDALQQAAESRDVGDFMAHISEQYRDEDGRGHREIRALTQLQFLRNPQIHTFKVIQRIDLIGEERASVAVLAALAGSPIEGVSALSGLRAELMRFELDFERDGDWKITGARWAPASIGNFSGGG